MLVLVDNSLTFMHSASAEPEAITVVHPSGRPTEQRGCGDRGYRCYITKVNGAVAIYVYQKLCIVFDVHTNLSTHDPKIKRAYIYIRVYEAAPCLNDLVG
jgi:hypothetical protein